MQAKASSTKKRNPLGEALFVGTLFLLIASIAIAATFWPKSLAGVVQVRVCGQQVASLRLDQNKRYEYLTKHGAVTIEVKDGKAGVLSSPCPDQLCVKEGYKDKEGDVIACVPEEVVLSFLCDKAIEEIVV